MLCDMLSNELVSISSSQILTDILFSMVTSSGNLNLMETFKYLLQGNIPSANKFNSKTEISQECAWTLPVDNFSINPTSISVLTLYRASPNA